jgi:hypothetical protein
MPEEIRERVKHTWFPKGNKPQNHKPVGHERITRDGYKEVKVSEPNVFKLYHRLIWEQHNGPIPKGYNIQFKDGDKLNTTIENLYIISRKEQMLKNNIHNYPKELIPLIILQGKLNKKIKQHGKKQNRGS